MSTPIFAFFSKVSMQRIARSKDYNTLRFSAPLRQRIYPRASGCQLPQ